MQPKDKDPYKFENPLENKKHSVAGRRHERHEKHARHPHTILGALAPDAAPGTNPNEIPLPQEPAPLPPKPVNEILPTALPAKESFDEAAIVARSAFHPQYVVPKEAINPVLYGPATGNPNDPEATVPAQDYDLSASGKGSSSAKTLALVFGLLFVLTLVTLIVAVAVLSKK
jgi:hypothetical protein